MHKLFVKEIRIGIPFVVLAVVLSSCTFDLPPEIGAYYPCRETDCPHLDRCSCLAGWVCVPDDADGRPEDCFPDCGPKRPCDDNNGCTRDSCDLDKTCTFTPVADGESCDDGDPCTMDDICHSGDCGGEPLDADADGYIAEACPSGDDCDDDDSGVHPGVFEGGPPASMVCSDNVDNDCDGLTDSDPACSACSQNSDCDDANLCNGQEICVNGSCQIGTALDCDDGNPCTDDSCDDMLGCQHMPNTAPCDDGDPCTEGDLCSGGSCQPGIGICDCESQADCDDGNDCTQDFCNQVSHACEFNPVTNGTTCDDGDPCTGGDHCAAGVCQPGTQGTCDAEVCDNDGFDEDDDGLTDCLDMDCYAQAGCMDECGASAITLTCGDQLPGDTGDASNQLSWYNCVPWDETGPEDHYTFTAPRSSKVIMGVVGIDGFDPDLFVLYPDCAQHECVLHTDIVTALFLPQGETLHLVVDGFDGGQGFYFIGIECEDLFENCLNGVDDDLDGQIDCQDLDCQAETGCQGSNFCTEPRPAPCGMVHFGDTTQPFLESSDTVDTYGPDCGPQSAYGPEAVWKVEAPPGTGVTAWLSTAGAVDLDLYVVPGCDPGACLASSQPDGDPLTFTIGAEGSSYLVVDGPDGAAGAYSILLDCDSEICESSYDDDLDGFTNCADPECHGHLLCNSNEICMTGRDEDVDGATDCDDSDCRESTDHCPESGLCRSAETVSCGAEFAMGTSWPQATDVINTYLDASGGSFDRRGPEYAVGFRPAGNGMVTVSLQECVSSTPETPGMHVLAGACRGNELLVHGPTATSWLADSNSEYFLVLDAPEGTVASCIAALDCAFEDCMNALDDDSDGDVDCADLDCQDTNWCPEDTCTTDEVIECGDSVTFTGSTSGNHIMQYPLCEWEGDDSPVLHPGGEAVWEFGPGDRSEFVSVMFAPGTTGASVFVLEDACDARRCVASGSSIAEFTAVADRTYYLVLEPGLDDAVEATVTCVTALEDCLNGVDDDGDTHVDCDDPECSGNDSCDPSGRCLPVPGFWLGCGDWVLGDTSTGVATDVIDAYLGECAGTPTTGAPELVVPFFSTEDASVSIQLDHPDAIDLDLHLLTGDCAPAACVQRHSYLLEFDALAGRIYLIAVDGPEGNAGTFDLRVECH